MSSFITMKNNDKRNSVLNHLTSFPLHICSNNILGTGEHDSDKTFFNDKLFLQVRANIF